MKEMKSVCGKGSSPAVFTAAGFPLARLWSQPRCSSTGEGIVTMMYVYTKGHQLSHKQE